MFGCNAVFDIFFCVPNLFVGMFVWNGYDLCSTLISLFSFNITFACIVWYGY